MIHPCCPQSAAISIQLPVRCAQVESQISNLLRVFPALASENWFLSLQMKDLLGNGSHPGTQGSKIIPHRLMRSGGEGKIRRVNKTSVPPAKSCAGRGGATATVSYSDFSLDLSPFVAVYYKPPSRFYLWQDWAFRVCWNGACVSARKVSHGFAFDLHR